MGVFSPDEEDEEDEQLQDEWRAEALERTSNPPGAALSRDMDLRR